MVDVIWYGAGMIWRDLVLHCDLWYGMAVWYGRWVWNGMVGLYSMVWYGMVRPYRGGMRNS